MRELGCWILLSFVLVSGLSASPALGAPDDPSGAADAPIAAPVAAPIAAPRAAGAPAEATGPSTAAAAPTEAPAKSPSTSSSVLGSVLAGTAACAGVDALGGVTTCLGFGLTQASPGGSTGNCAEDCVRSLVAGVAVAMGAVIGAVGLLVLGPVAALAVTGASMLGAGLSSRNVWAAGVGGLPGVALGVVGVALAGVGGARLLDAPGGLSRGLSVDPQTPEGLALSSGVLLTALAGPVSLAGALGGDLLFGAPSEEGGAPAAVSASEREQAPEAWWPTARAIPTSPARPPAEAVSPAAAGLVAWRPAPTLAF